MRRRVPMLLILILLASGLAVVAPPAAAGNAQNPEVTDAGGDTYDTLRNQAVTGAGVRDLDLLAGWFSNDRSTFSVHIRVTDLGAQFRDGVTSHHWQTSWEHDGYTFVVWIGRDSLGNEHGDLSILGTSGGVTRTDDGIAPGDASLDFDLSTNTITFTSPRTLPRDDVTFELEPGETFENLRLVAREAYGSRADGCNFPCIQIDDTRPGRKFTLGAGPPHNGNMITRPDAPVIGATPGEPTPVGFTVTNHQAFEIGGRLDAHIDAPGWTVSPDQQDVTVAPDATSNVAYSVTPPNDAMPGTVATMTVEGGDITAHTLVVVGDVAADYAQALTATPTEPELGPALPRSLHLMGKTTSDAGVPGTDTGRPVFPGHLVPAAPAGSDAAVISLDFPDAASIIPVGTWRSAPVRSATTLTGPWASDLWVEWGSLEGVRLQTLVGPAPLPLYWDGADPPPGLVHLESAPASAPNDRALITATSSTGTIELATGDSLAVANYLTKDSGQGTVTARVYADAFDGRIDFQAATPIAASQHASAPQNPSLFALPSSPQPFQSTAQADARAYSLTIVKDGTELTTIAPLFALPHSLTIGDANNRDRTYSGSFSATDVKTSQSHQVDVDPAEAAVTFELSADHADSRFVDHVLWLELYRLDDDGNRTFVKAARAYGPEQTLHIGPEDIAKHGPGQYTLDVILDAYGQDTEDIAYVVTASHHGSITLPDRWQDQLFLVDPTSLTPGEHVFRFTTTTPDGATHTTEQILEVTHTGITQPPVAAFQADIDDPTTGQTLRFTDNSFDPDGTITDWRWHFGDGTTSNTSKPTHTYTKAGTYTVSLVVTDDFGARSLTAFTTIIVGSIPGSTIPDPDDVSLPDPAKLPLGGTMRYFGDLYAAGIAHIEHYDDAWRNPELDGHIGTEYLSSPDGPQTYIDGTLPASTATVTWDDHKLATTNVVGAAIDYDARTGLLTQTSGSAAVNTATLSDISIHLDGQDIGPVLRASSHEVEQDDFASGGLDIVTPLNVPGTDAEHRMHLVDGFAHSDVRTILTGQPDQRLDLQTTATLSVRSDDVVWAAIERADGTIDVAPAAHLKQRILAPQPDAGKPSVWVALFDPAQQDVAGLVVSGDLASVTFDWDDVARSLTIHQTFEATEQLVAANYPITYTVGNANSTRYAGVQAIALQDAQEIGIALLDHERTASQGWAGSAARLDILGSESMRALTTGWHESYRYNLEVEASSLQNGKAIRFVLDRDATRGGLTMGIDGIAVPSDAFTAEGDDRTLIVQLPIPHFSLHKVFVDTLAPGVAPVFKLLTILFALIIVAITIHSSLTTARKSLLLSALKKQAEGGASATLNRRVRRLIGLRPHDPDGNEAAGYGPRDQRRLRSWLLLALGRSPDNMGGSVPTSANACPRCGHQNSSGDPGTTTACARCGQQPGTGQPTRDGEDTASY